MAESSGPREKVSDENSYDRVRDIPAMKRLIGARLDDVSCSDKGEDPSEVYYYSATEPC